MNASVPATGGASTSTSPEAARSAAAATAAAGPLRLALAAAESVRSCSNSCLSRSFSACKADSCATSLGSVGPPPGRGDAVAAVEVAERPALPLLGVAEVEAVGCGCRGKMRQVAAGNAMRKAGRQGRWVGVAALHTACAPRTALWMCMCTGTCCAPVDAVAQGCGRFEVPSAYAHCSAVTMPAQLREARLQRLQWRCPVALPYPLPLPCEAAG